MTDAYTENLAEFGIREIRLLNELLTAWLVQGLPDNFYPDGVKPAFNKNSGSVFLTNEDYQVAMMNGDKLETFYYLPYSGDEGFLSDLLSGNDPDELNQDDIEYLLEASDNAYLELPKLWIDYKIGCNPEIAG